ncbi:MAG: sodium:proton antiporter [Aureliella sp.]
MSENLFPFFLVLVLTLGISAQWLAWRMKIPSILLLLVFGVCLGIWISPDEVLGELAGTDSSFAPKLLFPIVSLSVAVILFEGGLTLRWNQLGSSAGVVFRLIAVSSLLTWGLTAVLSHYLLGFSWQLAWLLGAILMVTGPTVVGPLLRQIRPNRSTSSILQWEGILIDPVGAVAAVLVFEVVVHSGAMSPVDVIVVVLETLAIGLIAGCAAAALSVLALRKYWVPDFLHGVFFLVVALAAFWGSNWLREESGLVTVTILGICLANQRCVSVEHVLEFKEHLRVLLISCLFIVLGSRLQLSSLAEIGWLGIPFVLLLVFLIRPISVYLGTIGTGWAANERAFVGLVAPRGIVAASVASVFGLKLASLEQVADPGGTFAKAELLVPVTFLTILGTVLVCGLGASPLARRLGLSDANPQGVLFAGASRWVREFALVLQSGGIRVAMIDTNYGNVTAARLEGLTAKCGNVLSEHVQEEQDLSGIGSFLACTPSDEVNTLATMEYMHLFSRAGVFQLPARAKQHERWESIPESRRGRTLFDADLSHKQLESMVEAGGVIKATPLTESFKMEQFREQHGDDAIVLALLSSDGKLQMRVASGGLDPAPGDSVLALIPPSSDTDGGQRQDDGTDLGKEAKA